MESKVLKRWSELLAHAEESDRCGDWPAQSWDIVRNQQALRWSIPTRFGGLGWSHVEQLAANELLAAHCLTTAFILSQREAAIRLLLKGPEALQERFLMLSATGEIYLTVGLSQLTTSRQHGAPALWATPVAHGYEINGVIPWVTAADQASAIMAGATLPDSTQIVFALLNNSPGVKIDPPMPLAALVGSRTTEVRCNNVFVPADLIIGGPKPQVLGPVGGGGLETSNLTLGTSLAALKLMESEIGNRPEVREAYYILEPERITLGQSLHDCATSPPNPDRVLAIRTATTILALRTTQTALMLAKGAGFIAPHSAQRLARQAHFFLVWSCPRPVADGVRTWLLTGKTY